jgi:heme-degrading monooxygenase HmoA
MFAVVFEVHPGPGKKDEYLGLAKHLKPILESIDGFIDNERFESKRREDWVLSLSTWRDEKSLVRWRSEGEHHRVQERGRAAVLSDYHLRVCEVTADTHPPEGIAVPDGIAVAEQRFDATEVGDAKALAITEASPTPGAALGAHADRLASHLGLDTRAEGLADCEVFESIYNLGKMLLLTSWRTADLGGRWRPKPFAGVGELRHRQMRTIRDYGMFDRREAPQYYPPVNDAAARSQS